MLRALGFGGGSRRTTAETLGWLQLPAVRDDKAVIAVLSKTDVERIHIESEADAEIIVVCTYPPSFWRLHTTNDDIIA
jgi:hypothetical protein